MTRVPAGESSTVATFRPRLLASLRFAQRSLPVLGAYFDSGRDDEQAVFRQAKFASETALLLYAAEIAASADDVVHALVSDIAEQVSPYVRSEELLTMMRLRPSDAAELSTGHTCLTGLGHRDPEFDDALAHLLEHAPPLVPERVPWKDLEADWWARVGGVLPRVGDLEAARERTGLIQGLDALLARRQDLYAFTHGLMYLTDFGRDPATLSRRAGAIVADADAALARCLDDDDFDLAGEVLLTWPYLQAPRTATADFGLQVLTRVDDDLGFLPSLSLRVDELEGLEPEEETQALLSEAYHTIYVMGLLAAAMLLSSEPVGEQQQPTPGGARVLLELLPDRTPRPQWQQDFENLSASRQDELTAMLASVALRRALRASDLRRIRDLLTASLEVGVGTAPAVRQSAQLLRRFTPKPLVHRRH